MVYQLIKTMMKTQNIGYRKVSKKLNSFGIKTQRGNKWYPSSVYSVLKRRHQRDSRIENVRNKDYPVQISKFEIKTVPFI